MIVDLVVNRDRVLCNRVVASIFLRRTILWILGGFVSYSKIFTKEKRKKKE